MNIVEIENLTYSYPAASEPTLKNISLQIPQGDFLAVVGNNGCGKSTLCKVLNGLIPHFITGSFSGSVKVGGLDTVHTDVGTLARKVGYVYQDFENQIVRPTVLDDASYACLNYAIPDYAARGLEALSLCGLQEKKSDYIWQLSGGQTHLLALAGAVALRPDILILDEPIAQLDPRHADHIYEILRELNEKHGKTIIVIEHHTDYIANYCKNVLLLKDGSFAWQLPTQEALQRVEELQACNIFPPQITLAAYRMKQAGLLSPHAPLPTTIETGKKIFDKLAYAGTQTRPQAESSDEEDIIARFHSVFASYKTIHGKDGHIFEGLDLEIKRGDKIAVIGSNGAGKTTLMKLMIGLMKPSWGNITIFGGNIRRQKGTNGAKQEAFSEDSSQTIFPDKVAVPYWSPEELSRMISLVYQNPEEMFIQDSIQADIAYAMKMRGVADYENRTAELLERFRLTELKERDGRLLSGGQMRRASLAIGIALHPEILLLDEPTANLDIATRKEIMRTLNDIKHITKTVIIATHDMQLVCEWAQRIVVLCRGKVIADGTRDEIFGNAAVIAQAGIRPPEIFSMGRALHQRALCYTVDEFLENFAEVQNEQ